MVQIIYSDFISILIFSSLVCALSLSLPFIQKGLSYLNYEFILTVIRPVTRNIACNRARETTNQ